MPVTDATFFQGTARHWKVEGREFRPRLGGDYQITARFESDPDERLYGMGQYQQPYLNLKGCKLDNYRYHIGSNMQIGNLYPVMYAKAFYDGMKAEGNPNIVNLLRCARADSQKYGALVWSGDIASSFDSMRNQLAAALSMGLAGIPWWTTDIGGFHGGGIHDRAFRELLIRWVRWGIFCPVMRLRNDRGPHLPKLNPDNPQEFPSGAPNEVWSYGDEVYEVLKKYLSLRESLRPYICEQIKKSARNRGARHVSAVFDFPDDGEAWKIEDQYMFGSDYLAAPILEAGQRSRVLYLPKGAN